MMMTIDEINDYLCTTVKDTKISKVQYIHVVCIYIYMYMYASWMQ